MKAVIFYPKEVSWTIENISSQVNDSLWLMNLKALQEQYIKWSGISWLVQAIKDKTDSMQGYLWILDNVTGAGYKQWATEKIFAASYDAKSIMLLIQHTHPDLIELGISRISTIEQASFSFYINLLKILEHENKKEYHDTQKMIDFCYQKILSLEITTKELATTCRRFLSKHSKYERLNTQSIEKLIRTISSHPDISDKWKKSFQNKQIDAQTYTHISQISHENATQFIISAIKFNQLHTVDYNTQIVALEKYVKSHNIEISLGELDYLDKVPLP